MEQTYGIRRIAHFKEWLQQGYIDDVNNVPREIFLKVKEELITSPTTPTPTLTYKHKYNETTVMNCLRKLSLQKYYSCVPNIMYELNNKKRVIINPELALKIIDIFTQLQEPFEKHYKGRSFMSYHYTLYKILCHLNEYTGYLYKRNIVEKYDCMWSVLIKEIKV